MHHYILVAAALANAGQHATSIKTSKPTEITAAHKQSSSLFQPGFLVNAKLHGMKEEKQGHLKITKKTYAERLKTFAQALCFSMQKPSLLKDLSEGSQIER